MDTLGTATRRQPAPHPGPMIASGLLEPLHLDAESLAEQIGMDATLLREILEGRASFDVESAVRLSRSLQLNPKTLMERQLRHDFACARADKRLESIPVLADDGRLAFPENGFLRGRIAGLPDTSGYNEIRFETLSFIADATAAENLIARMYEIRPGGRLRIYGEDGATLWKGVILQSLDGVPILPFARPKTWIEWFAHRYRADFIPAPLPLPRGDDDGDGIVLERKAAI